MPPLGCCVRPRVDREHRCDCGGGLLFAESVPMNRRTVDGDKPVTDAVVSTDGEPVAARAPENVSR